MSKKVREQDQIQCLVDQHLDEAFIRETLTRLVKSPSDVPKGEISIQPDAPKITRYMQDTVLPLFRSVGVQDLNIDDLNNLVGRLGRGINGTSLLLVGYSVSQHANRMEDPYSGKVMSGKDYGWPEPCVFGKGASQNKGSLTALLAALKLLKDAQIALRGELTVAVNSEGESSHRCMQHLIQSQELHSDAGLLCIGTGNRISLGNRGRVDVYVTVRGKVAHSSQPWLGANAIHGLREVLNRLKDIDLPGKHPKLGASQLTPYNLSCFPSSPHTIPDRCELLIDRRFLPSEDVGEIVNEITKSLQSVNGFSIDVVEGPLMLPALVADDLPVVKFVQEGQRIFTGTAAQTIYPDYTFDAGYPCSVGIPTIMYGPASWADVNLNEEIVQSEFVAVSQVITAAKVYAYLLLNSLGYG